MERLNQPFGIRIMELKANSFESKILFPASYREIDFKTLDKLCKINPEFEKFIGQTEKVLTAGCYEDTTKRKLADFCDAYFKTDSEVEVYCKERRIPMD